MKFDQHLFNQFILDCNIIGFYQEARILSSGRSSHWYTNWRTVSNNAFLLYELTDYVINFCHDNEILPDCFYGVPDGATKLALFTQNKWIHLYKKTPILPMGRVKEKRHGDPKDKYFIGEPQGNVVILEDVSTTGDSMINEFHKIFELNSQRTSTYILHAISLTDRMEKRDDGHTVQSALAQFDVPYNCLSNALDILPLAVEKYKPTPEIIKAIEKEYEKYGVERLVL